MNPFTSTRNATSTPANFTQAILSPAADSKGLYTLATLPIIDFRTLLDSSYNDLCKAIFTHLKIEIDSSVLDAALHCYASFDDPNNPAPITQRENAYFLELYHGPTRAFKDMALCPFGSLFSSLAAAHNQRYLILTATSGDTGPATLAALASKPNVKVICLYPDGGTSQVQGLQMQTASAPNLKTLGIVGDFDTAQSLLKSLLNSQDFTDKIAQKGYKLSAANSVNFGRIAFQIIYYIWGYLTLVRQGAMKWGEKLAVSVPSGNFGNALGAFLAKCMGLPLGQIIIASNQNNILTELITSGVYDIAGRSLSKSISPAMDILKSSNVERVLFYLYGDTRTKELQESLESTSRYALSGDELEKLQEHFCAWWGDDTKAREMIRTAFDKGYILDPHTALAYGAHCAINPSQKTLVCATAEWSKFAPSVVEAIFGKRVDDKQAIQIMLDAGASIGAGITELFSKPKLHTQVLEKEQVEGAILQWL